MPDQSNEAAGSIADGAFVLSEREIYGAINQELLVSADDLAAVGTQVKLSVGPSAEDRSDRTVLVLQLPLEQIGGTEGFYVLSIGLSVGSTSQESVMVRRAEWSTTENPASLIVETPVDAVVDGRWAYSLRPRIRTVLVSDDDPSLGFDGSVLHVADFGPGPVQPKTAVLDDGWIRSTFEVPLWLIDQTPLAEACERVVTELDSQLAGDDLRWEEASVDQASLNKAAETIEREWLPEGQQANLTLDIGGREIIRGKRLQPFVRYPVTLVDDAGNPLAASLGCTISAV